MQRLEHSLVERFDLVDAVIAARAEAMEHGVGEGPNVVHTSRSVRHELKALRQNSDKEKGDKYLAHSNNKAS